MAVSADPNPALDAVMNDLVKAGWHGSKGEGLRDGVRRVQKREARRLGPGQEA